MESSLDKNVESKMKSHKKFCRLCLQHDIVSPRTAHQCNYENCGCVKCTTIKTQRKIMSEQIRLRRSEKRQEKLNNNGNNMNFKQIDKSVSYWCQKCRNHNVKSLKKKHKPCPFSTCKCSKCFLISARSICDIEVKRTCSNKKNANYNDKIDNTDSIESQNSIPSSSLSIASSSQFEPLSINTIQPSNLPHFTNNLFHQNQNIDLLSVLNKQETCHKPQNTFKLVFTPQNNISQSLDFSNNLSLLQNSLWLNTLIDPTFNKNIDFNTFQNQIGSFNNFIPYFVYVPMPVNNVQ